MSLIWSPISTNPAGPVLMPSSCPWSLAHPGSSPAFHARPSVDHQTVAGKVVSSGVSTCRPPIPTIVPFASMIPLTTFAPSSPVTPVSRVQTTSSGDGIGVGLAGAALAVGGATLGEALGDVGPDGGAVVCELGVAAPHAASRNAA